ncbi:MAG: DUF1549 domain-containing protein, partial [Bacteroidota bacterium]
MQLLFSAWHKWFSVLVVSLFFSACGPSLPQEVEVASRQLPNKIDFNLHVKPILSDRCFACHGPDKANQKAGLRLDEPTAAFAALAESPDQFAIVPGDISGSQAILRILSDKPEEVMPPPESNLRLSPYEKAVLIQWVRDGAVYKPHWSFEPAKRPDLPKGKYLDQFHQPIDRFVAARLKREGLLLQAEAEKEILFRRLSLDLRGLPPSTAEIDSFLKDSSPTAYENWVEHFLRSPHFGERL